MEYAVKTVAVVGLILLLFAATRPDVMVQHAMASASHALTLTHR